MWIANLEDNTAVSSKTAFWTHLADKKVRLKGLQLTHPTIQGLNLALSGLDKYYYAKEAVVSPQQPDPTTPIVTAEIIGGFNEELGIGVQITLELRGKIRFSAYKISEYKFSPQILIQGIRNKKDAKNLAMSALEAGQSLEIEA